MHLSQRSSDLGTETAFEVFAKAQKLQAEGRDVVMLHIGAPDFQTPPNIVAAGEQALRDGWHKYTAAKGLLELREAVCEDIAERRGAEVSPEDVLIAPGGKPTMFYALLMFGEPGAEILYPDPGFPIYESMIRYSGATPVPIELLEESGFTFSAEAVLAKITPRTRMIVINSPANPTGGIVPRAEMDALVAGLEEHPDVVVLSDEIYARLIYDGEEHVSILQYPQIRERAILLDGWSKTYAMTGWRLGYGVWPSSLVDHAERLQINSTSCPNAVTQVAAIEALRGPQDAVQEMRSAFDERRRIIHAELNDVPGFSCVMPKGAFYAFPNTSGTGIPSGELEQRFLFEAGVACLSGTSFGHLGEGYLRFSYANSVENIREGVRRVRECLQPA